MLHYATPNYLRKTAAAKYHLNLTVLGSDTTNILQQSFSLNINTIFKNGFVQFQLPLVFLLSTPPSNRQTQLSRTHTFFFWTLAKQFDLQKILRYLTSFDYFETVSNEDGRSYTCLVSVSVTLQSPLTTFLLHASIALALSARAATTHGGIGFTQPQNPLYSHCFPTCCPIL